METKHIGRRVTRISQDKQSRQAKPAFHHCQSLCITGHHCSSLSITVYHCSSLFTIAHPYSSLSITVHHCPSLSISVHHCPSLFITGRPNQPNAQTSGHECLPRVPRSLAGVTAARRAGGKGAGRVKPATTKPEVTVEQTPPGRVMKATSSSRKQHESNTNRLKSTIWHKLICATGRRSSIWRRLIERGTTSQTL